MPTYGYECTQCSDFMEVFQKITDDALTICEKCGGGLRKRMFPVGIVFKGSGFYVNDYASKKAASSESAKPADDTKASAPVAPEAPAAKSESTAAKPAESKQSGSDTAE